MKESKLELQISELKKEDMRFLFKLRDEFRKWYGRLPISELISNERLVKEIEEIERMFSPAQGATV